MSRFYSAFIISSSLALFSLSAPLANAQAAAAYGSSVLASQLAPDADASQLRPTPMQVHHTADRCFTEDLVPDDDSSMLTVCGAEGPARVIFKE